MDWNGWQAMAQARGEGLRPEFLEGLERSARRPRGVLELDAYRREEGHQRRDAHSRESCVVIPFPVLAKPRAQVARQPVQHGLKPRTSRAPNLSRPGRRNVKQQPE